MVEQIVVCFLVGGVALLVGRRFYKVLKGDTGGCGCEGGGCARTRSCDQSDGASRVWEDAD